MNAPRARWAGLAAATLYLVAALVTIGTNGHRLRPIYEGIGPAAPYNWVNPPAAFKASNTRPGPVTESVDLAGAGSPAAVVTSGDGQLVISVPAGALPVSPADRSIFFSIKPLDPAKLGALPVGLFSDGNAYQLTAVVRPSGRTIDSTSKPMDAVIVTPATSIHLLQSSDGRSWAPIPDHHIPKQAAVSATVTKFGYLLAAANVPVVTRSAGGSSRVLLVVVLGIVAVLPLAAAVLWRNGRRRRAS
jgi:hypothetical protein